MADSERGRSGRPKTRLTSAATWSSPVQAPSSSGFSVWDSRLKAICSLKTFRSGSAPLKRAALWLASSWMPGSSKAETGWRTKVTALAKP